MATEAAPRRGARPTAFALAFWLGVTLVLAKSVHFGLPSADYSGSAWLRDVAIASAADIGFAVGFGLAAFLVLAASRRWARFQRGAGIALLSLGAFCALYAVASIQIFDFLRSPLTYTLLYLAGDMQSMRSSIGSFVTPGIVLAFVVVTSSYVLVVWATSRAWARRSRAVRLAVPAAMGLAAAAWAWKGTEIAGGRWSDRPDVLIAASPHWEFLSSFALELRGGSGVPAMDETFPPEFLDDFRPRPASLRVPAVEPRSGRLPRNVIQLVLESTGARYMGLYGSPYATTPHLEAEAAHALVFDNFYTPVGFTANALASVSLSLYPYMTWREYTQEYPRFPGVTIPEVLRSKGYRTAFLSSSYLDYVCMDCFLKDRGYGDVRDVRAIGGSAALTSWGGDERRLIEHTLEWVDEDRTKPFFVTLWTQQTHHPYEPLPEAPVFDFFQGRALPPDDYDLGRYLNTVAYMDEQIGRLFDGLRARGLENDTIVIVTGDHGEAFGDPHETWGHGFRLYQEGVRIPLMIWSPALFPKGRRVDTIGSHVDMNPTIADLLQIPVAASWEGRSLFAKKRPPRAYFYAANDDYLLGIREDQYKYIYNATRGRDELYDLSRDPDERTNIADAHRDRCRVWRQRLAAWRHHAAGTLAAAQRAMEARPVEPKQALLD